MAADHLRFNVADPGFTSANVAVRLGSDAVHRLDFVSLSGGFTSGGAVGTFSGGLGTIANVPLLPSDAIGKWSVLGGDRTVDNTITVADDQDPGRFYPPLTHNSTLPLTDG